MMPSNNLDTKPPTLASPPGFPSSRHAEPKWETACFDREALFAKFGKTGDSIDHAAAKQVLHEMMLRAGKFAKRVLAGEEEQLRCIVQGITSPRVQSFEGLRGFNSDAKMVASRLAQLDRFIEDCLETVEELLRTNSDVSLEVKAQDVGLTPGLLDHACVALADIFHCIRQQQQNLEKPPNLTNVDQSVWVPPDSFERKSKKFVVSRGRCLEVKLKIAEHLPVLIMNRPSVNPNVGVPADFLAVSGSSWVCSQYFDNDTVDCYHARVQRLDGAKAYRIRWYNSSEAPKAEDDVFFERKTHHVEWVAQSSVKERFKLACKEVQPFLAGSSLPKLSEKSQRLANEVQAELRDGEMKAVLRTLANRMAFQSTNQNDVRVSFDTDVCFMEEKTGIVQRPGTFEWCSNTDIGSAATKTFGSAGILEVKINTGGELPSWVIELEQSGAIIPMPNLSKFCHGMYAFSYQFGNINLQPYWFTACNANGEFGGPPIEDATAGLDQPKGDKAEVKKADVPVAVKPKKPAEAKTFFSNERTLLQWISPVSLVLSISIAMLGWSSSLSAGAQRSMAALATGMMCLSMLWLAYALWIYLKRMRKIRSQDEAGFEETTGPTIMVLSMCVFCVLALVRIYLHPLTVEAGPDPVARACSNNLASSTDFPVLGVQPSGAIFHAGRNSLFIASVHHLLEILANGRIVDHRFPGFDIEAVTLDPDLPDIMYLGLEGPNQIVAVNLTTMKTFPSVKVDHLMGKHDQLESMAVCPADLCGEGGKRFLVGGPSNSLRVLDLGLYPKVFPRVPAFVDEIDIDALLCRRNQLCAANRTGRITDLYISSSDVYAVAAHNSELLRIPWSGKTQLGGPPGLPQVMPLPRATMGGWQGFCLMPESYVTHGSLSSSSSSSSSSSHGKAVTAILANDFHGFVKEFQITANGVLSSDC